MPASKVTYFDSEGNRKTYIGDPRLAPKSYPGKKEKGGEMPTDPRIEKNEKRKKTMQKFQLGKKYNIGGRANLLEEMGRIDARRHPDAADRAEKRRVIGELNRGYKSGGAIKVRDINKDGKKEGWEVARAKGMAKGMGKRLKMNSGGAVLKGKKVGCQIK